jgi:hypothetical protein
VLGVCTSTLRCSQGFLIIFSMSKNHKCGGRSDRHAGPRAGCLSSCSPDHFQQPTRFLSRANEVYLISTRKHHIGDTKDIRAYIHTSKLLKGFSPTFPISNQHLSAYVMAEVTDVQNQRKAVWYIFLSCSPLFPPFLSLSLSYISRIKARQYITSPFPSQHISNAWLMHLVVSPVQISSSST